MINLKIPSYIDCKNNESICDYLMIKQCEQTCPYCLSLGIGGSDIETARRLKDLYSQSGTEIDDVYTDTRFKKYISPEEQTKRLKEL